ncbi:hypothetical protein B296_00024302 [Ensete ventricosum]|uniref:Pentacotripeptide-repeat region of PRORP domain-containing protein n=1 Tax=Ensete ventricosum TaxID=4639 RepID=A0A427AIG3_ENSVE|nr:hypothetical protein B296_00024302 [Ensete ventricosum]
MQTTLSKLLFNNLSRQLCHMPKASILGRCLPAIDFSTSNDPGGQTGGGRRSDDGSEDLFLRSLNFGDDGGEEQERTHQKAPSRRPSARPPRLNFGDDGGEEQERTHQEAPSRRLSARPPRLNFGDGGGEEQERTHQEAPPRRPSAMPPLRGGQQSRNEPSFRGDGSIDIASGDLFPDLEFGDESRGLRGRSRNGPVRRDTPREDFGRRDTMDGFGTGPQRSPSRSAGGSRGEELDDGGEERRSDRIGDSLAQKFNLGEAGRHKRVEEADQKPAVAESAAQEAPPEDADDIFKKMKEIGLIPNAVAMLDGLCKDGLVQDAMKLFGLMREKGTIPEVVIYTAVVEGFCKAAKFDDAKRIFRKMQKNGIAPNAFSFKVLIQGLCKGKKLEDSVEFCMEMLDAGHSPSVATLIGVVDGFCKEKGVEEAENVIIRLRERGFVLDEGAVREHLNKKGPVSPNVWDAFFGKKNSRGPF